MAIATNTSLTYSSVAIREDLSDVIYNIAPMDTPFLLLIVSWKAMTHRLLRQGHFLRDLITTPR